jgi:PrgI family protein
MRFEVPQFIEIEDKIFGPLTWRQFLYLGGGLGASIVIFLLLPFVFFLFLGLPIALLAGALAFYLEAVINYFTGQRLYLWRKKEEAVYKVDSDEMPHEPMQPVVRTKKAADITSLARKLELQAIQKQQ